MAKVIPWKTLHTRIDGHVNDREWYALPIDLIMHAMGTQLPLSKQTRLLEITVGKESTKIDEEGIEALLEFLRMRPQ